jgi:hypothetical protein
MPLSCLWFIVTDPRELRLPDGYWSLLWVSASVTPWRRATPPKLTPPFGSCGASGRDHLEHAPAGRIGDWLMARCKSAIADSSELGREARLAVRLQINDHHWAAPPKQLETSTREQARMYRHSRAPRPIPSVPRNRPDVHLIPAGRVPAGRGRLADAKIPLAHGHDTGNPASRDDVRISNASPGAGTSNTVFAAVDRLFEFGSGPDGREWMITAIRPSRVKLRGSARVTGACTGRPFLRSRLSPLNGLGRRGRQSRRYKWVGCTRRPAIFPHNRPLHRHFYVRAAQVDRRGRRAISWSRHRAFGLVG